MTGASTVTRASTAKEASKVMRASTTKEGSTVTGVVYMWLTVSAKSAMLKDRDFEEKC